MGIQYKIATMIARASSREITPVQFPIALGGFAAGQHATRVDSPLEVNCLYLQEDAGAIVFVSIDLLYVTQELREAVLVQVKDLGITDGQLFFAASHTHYAPAIDSTKPALGQPEYQYRDRVANIVAEAIRDAVSGPKSSATVTLGRGLAEIGVNRRRKRAVRFVRGHLEVGKVGMSPNAKGPTDPLVTIVELRSLSGTVAYLWSAACHPTGLADAACVSAHWPGVVRQRLRQSADLQPMADATPVLFFQGFSGDVRPPSGRTKVGLLRRTLTRIRLGPIFENLDDSEYAAWANLAASQVLAIAKSAKTLEGPMPLGHARTVLSASQFASGANALPPVSFHRVSLGPIDFVGVSAEPVSGFAALVRALAPDRHVITVGCIDHVIGYWPLQHMFGEGGYEVFHHCPSFGINGCRTDVEATVLGQCRRLLATTT